MVIRSSSQMSAVGCRVRVTSARWLWAPAALISLEQGQRVVTGTMTVSIGSTVSAEDAVNPHWYSIRLSVPDTGARLAMK